MVDEITLDNIQMYVISLKVPIRLHNIRKQEHNIRHPIPIFDGVDGNKLKNQDTQELFKKGLLEQRLQNAVGKEARVVACYLSHLNLLRKIMDEESSKESTEESSKESTEESSKESTEESTKESTEESSEESKKFTIIFEDDFNILSPTTFLNDVQNILNKVPDFDLLFLGNIMHNKGERIIENVYKLNLLAPLWGTHAYIVNNKNIKKIVNHTQFLDTAIDDKYQILGKAGTLNIFVVHPILACQQLHTIPSTIN